MARLPNAYRAIINTEKLCDYVLSNTHAVGRFKAAFFRKPGYSVENWETFEHRLRELILSHDVTVFEESSYGEKIYR